MFLWVETREFKKEIMSEQEGSNPSNASNPRTNTLKLDNFPSNWDDKSLLRNIAQLLPKKTSFQRITVQRTKNNKSLVYVSFKTTNQVSFFFFLIFF